MKQTHVAVVGPWATHSSLLGLPVSSMKGRDAYMVVETMRKMRVAGRRGTLARRFPGR